MNETNENVTELSSAEDLSTSCPEDSSPPEVTASHSLAESSSNSLPVNGNATPGDHGDGEGGDVIGYKDKTSSGSGLPESDLRELEGEINREADGRIRPHVDSYLQEEDKALTSSATTSGNDSSDISSLDDVEDGISSLNGEGEDVFNNEDEQVIPSSDMLVAEKLNGNEKYSKGDVDGAITCWLRYIRSLEYILNKCDDNSVDNFEYFRSIYLSLCLNLSLGYLKKDEYSKCKYYCNCVFKYDKLNLKAYLRIIKADLCLCNYNDALKNCKVALLYYPNDNELLLLQHEISRRNSSSNKKHHKIMKKMFNELEHDPRIYKKHHLF